MKKLCFDEQGNFKSPNPVRLSKKVRGVRLPVDLEPIIIELAGEDVSAWLRQAAIEKADRDTGKIA
jgi:hypothetical protein